MKKNCLSCFFEPNWTEQPVKCRRYKSVATDTQLYFKDKEVFYYNESGEKQNYEFCPSWSAKESYDEHTFIVNGQVATICTVCNSIYVGDQCGTCMLCSAIMNVVTSMKILFNEIEQLKIFISKESKLKGEKIH